MVDGVASARWAILPILASLRPFTDCLAIAEFFGRYPSRWTRPTIHPTLGFAFIYIGKDRTE